MYDDHLISILETKMIARYDFSQDFSQDLVRIKRGSEERSTKTLNQKEMPEQRRYSYIWGTYDGLCGHTITSSWYP